jgi:hypothetical protein
MATIILRLWQNAITFYYALVTGRQTIYHTKKKKIKIILNQFAREKEVPSS